MGVNATPWTDDCCCSDYGLCMRHQYSDDPMPERPSQAVMDARTTARHRSIRIGKTLTILARNLRDAAGCALAFSSGVYGAASWLSGQLDGQAAWEPNCDGVALRGWEP